MAHPAAQRGKRPGIDPGKTYLSPNSNGEPLPDENEKISFEPVRDEGEQGKPRAYRVVINQEDQ